MSNAPRLYAPPIACSSAICVIKVNVYRVHTSMWSAVTVR